jgi:hypothetical protein
MKSFQQKIAIAVAGLEEDAPIFPQRISVFIEWYVDKRGAFGVRYGTAV